MLGETSSATATSKLASFQQRTSNAISQSLLACIQKIRQFVRDTWNSIFKTSSPTPSSSKPLSSKTVTHQKRPSRAQREFSMRIANAGRSNEPSENATTKQCIENISTSRPTQNI